MITYDEACVWCRTVVNAFVLAVYAALGGVLTMGIYLFVFDTALPERQTEAHWVDGAGNAIVETRIGAPVYSKRTICGTRIVPTTIWRRLENVSTGNVYPLTPIFAMTWDGCKTITTALVLPVGLPPGTYRYVVVPRYEINLLSQRAVSLPIADLIVIE